MPVPRLRAGRFWQGVSSLQYTRGRDHGGQPLPLISPLELQSSLRYQHRRWQAQAEGVWNAAQKAIHPEFGEDASPSFHIIHLQGSYRPVVGRYPLELTLGVENLLDRAYWHHLDWGNVLRPGRNLYANVAYVF